MGIQQTGLDVHSHQFHPQPESSSSQDNQSLAGEITLLAGQINAANYRFLKLIAEYDRREAWADFGIRSCAHWLNWKCGIALGAAREKVRVARCLDSLPGINEAFAMGEISYSKVRAMTRVASNDNEDYLLMIARHGTAQQMEQLVRKYQQVTAATEPGAAQRQHEARELLYYQDEQGMWVIRGRLPAESGALVIQAIEAALESVDELVADVSDTTKYPADAEQENVPAETSSESYPQRRADALVAVAKTALAKGLDGGTKASTSPSIQDRYQLVLHADINALRQTGEPVSAGESCQHHHGYLDAARIAPDVARRLACDATVVTAIDDGKGNTLNIGRKSRIVPAAMKRALAMRDGGCRFPGCCESRYTDAHHIKHWVDGGETSVDNLVTLCRHHHRELHRGLFNVVLRGDEFVFSKACGEEIESSFYPQFTKNVPAETFADYLEAQWPEIDKDTAVSRWAGEPMDFDMAIEGLMH